MNTQFKKVALELCVLSQLRKADKYGYELTETISREMELATGTLYLILKRLGRRICGNLLGGERRASGKEVLSSDRKRAGISAGAAQRMEGIYGSGRPIDLVRRKNDDKTRIYAAAEKSAGRI